LRTVADFPPRTAVEDQHLAALHDRVEAEVASLLLFSFSPSTPESVARNVSGWLSTSTPFSFAPGDLLDQRLDREVERHRAQVGLLVEAASPSTTWPRTRSSP
jgi:hypothetical protein